MSKQPQIYIAYADDNKPIADVLQAHLAHGGCVCLRRSDVNDDYGMASGLKETMDSCDAILVVDSEAFRAIKSNLELHYAQTLGKALIVVSLHQALDEDKSTEWVRLFDFSHKNHQDWQRIIDATLAVTRAAWKINHQRDEWLF